MTVVLVDTFTWDDCANCGHALADHSGSYEHFGCKCYLTDYLAGGELGFTVLTAGGAVLSYSATIFQA